MNTILNHNILSEKPNYLKDGVPTLKLETRILEIYKDSNYVCCPGLGKALQFQELMFSLNEELLTHGFCALGWWDGTQILWGIFQF